ncbi:hypothetical protein [Nonomuraea aridisoli]|uniref:Uncharacterized protein n=1 Tax=Nonomuraea aridisoli TaxID=2070368 RepID=A0A2W2E8M6_9ACTN|nr:hypothetical protein [Nonomuraea aridisoli]PZG20636.1 hypothetical protein C1J01_09040 [Nonomuraea aridisoli]
MHPLLTIVLFVAAYAVGVYLTRQAAREQLQQQREADLVSRLARERELLLARDRMGDALARLLAAVRHGRDLDGATAAAAAALNGHGYTGDLVAARAALAEAEAELMALRQGS